MLERTCNAVPFSIGPHAGIDPFGSGHGPHDALLPGHQHHGELSRHGPAPEQLQVQDGGGGEPVAGKIRDEQTDQWSVSCTFVTES